MTKRIARPALVALVATAGGLALLPVAAGPADAKERFEGCMAENPPNPGHHTFCFFSIPFGQPSVVHYRAWKLDLNGARILETTSCGDFFGLERTVTQNGVGSFQTVSPLSVCISLHVPSGGRIRAWVGD